MRAWIETFSRFVLGAPKTVARRVRAWIETKQTISEGFHPTVARRVRAWIETITKFTSARLVAGRTPCACVD